MAGYAASATLRGGNLRLARWGAGAGLVGPADVAAASTPADVAAVSTPATVAAPIELVGRPFDQRLGDWLASLGETWSQTTFFLFDPDSWR